MAASRDIMNLAASLIASRKYGEAEELLREELEKETNSVILLNRLAEIYTRTSRYSEAESLIERSLSIDPANHFTLQAKGDLYAAKKDYKRAAEIFTDLDNGRPGDFFLMKRLARVYHLSGRDRDALIYAEKAAETDPGRADIHHLLFQIYLDLEEYPAASECIERAIELMPENSYYNKEKLSLRVREKGLGSEDIKQSIELSDDDNPGMLKLLGEQLKKESRFSEAAEAYGRLVNIDASSFNRKMLAYAHYKAGEFDRAFRNFMILSDTEFHDNIFLSCITASARSEDEKHELLERMSVLVKNPAYRKLWGKIKKIQNEIKAGDDEKDS